MNVTLTERRKSGASQLALLLASRPCTCCGNKTTSRSRAGLEQLHAHLYCQTWCLCTQPQLKLIHYSRDALCNWSPTAEVLTMSPFKVVYAVCDDHELRGHFRVQEHCYGAWLWVSPPPARYLVEAAFSIPQVGQPQQKRCISLEVCVLAHSALTLVRASKGGVQFPGSGEPNGCWEAVG